MKPLRKIPHSLFFSVFLVIGFLFGSTVGNLTGKAASYDQAPAVASRPAALSGSRQQNVLVVVVDRLENQSPRFIGIWLALHLPNLPKLTFVPLYPGSNSGIDQPGLSEADMRLTRNKELDAGLVSALNAMDIWWNNYVIMDEIALAKALQGLEPGKLKALHLNAEFPNTLQLVASLPAAWENPVAALDAQTDLISTICATRSMPATAAELKATLREFSPHMKTDLNSAQIYTDFRLVMEQRGKLSCEFPTLKSSPAPSASAP